MSVPVRYSAAANNAVVDSGLSNTLQQEEQYYLQQQQQQHELYCQYNNNNIDNSNINLICENSNVNVNIVQQQQFMQQRSSMMSSVSPLSPTSSANNTIINNNSIMNEQPQQEEVSLTSTSSLSPISSPLKQQQQQQQLTSSSSSSSSSSLNSHHDSMEEEEEELLEEEEEEVLEVEVEEEEEEEEEREREEEEELKKNMMKPTTSRMAQAAAYDTDNTEMRTEWRRAYDSRYGTPGATGLEYQKYELEQQGQQTPANNNDQPMEPSLMDNENMNKNGSNINDPISDELNALSTDELYAKLKECYVLQDKYHTILILPKEDPREVTCGGRDGSAYVLRCLKMWYDLPSDVLFSAMSMVDRFLDRMAVKPKHMACMSVASFYMAIKQLDLKPIPTEDLVTISQCGCTPGDLERMSNVIGNKLGITADSKPITAITFLRIYHILFRRVAEDIGGKFWEFFKQYIKLQDMINRLEIFLCDTQCTHVTPSTLALVLVAMHLDYHIKASYTRGTPELKVVFEYILFMQQFMGIPDRVFTCGFSVVSDILSNYNGENKQPYKQRLVWRLSSRTLRVLRPTNRFSSDLPTIEEGIGNAMDEGIRSRTESSSSEEEEDWPTSAIIPIFEQC